MLELVDRTDLKSVVTFVTCGFESRPRHNKGAIGFARAATARAASSLCGAIGENLNPFRIIDTKLLLEFYYLKQQQKNSCYKSHYLLSHTIKFEFLQGFLLY